MVQSRAWPSVPAVMVHQQNGGSSKSVFGRQFGAHECPPPQGETTSSAPNASAAALAAFSNLWLKDI